jgi:hypothetical protein
MYKRCMTPTELKQIVESTITALTAASGVLDIHSPTAEVLAAALASAPLCDRDDGPQGLQGIRWKAYGEMSPGTCWVSVSYRANIRLVLHSVPLTAVEGGGMVATGHIAS